MLPPAEFAQQLLKEAQDTHPWLHHPLFHMIWDGKLSDIVWGTIPFHLLMFVLLIMLVFWPEIALWLPHHMSAPP